MKKYTRKKLEKISELNKLWNETRYNSKVEGKRADLSEVNLFEMNLDNLNLESANLKSANLESANLESANLESANLESANLNWANLKSANLKSANLKSANLKSANLESANLNWANLESANLESANLNWANLKSAKNIPKIYCDSLSLLKAQKGTLIAYKYLSNDRVSPIKNFKYELGKTYTEDNPNLDERILCGAGINVAPLDWCLRQTNCDLDNYIYCVFKFKAKDIIAIPYNTDGKFRTRSAKYEKDLTKEFLKEYIKDLYPSED